MKVSAAGLNFISQWEGTVLHVYKDSAGKDTIGIGHLLRPGESYPNGITHEQAMDLLASDISVAEQAVNSLGVQLIQCEFDACASLAYNIGAGAFTSSTLARYIKGGRFDLAADEFLRWDKVNGQPNAGLHNRRVAERALFLSQPQQGPQVDPGSADEPATIVGLGKATKAVVEAFQRSNGLVADGVIGPATLRALLAARSD